MQRMSDDDRQGTLDPLSARPLYVQLADAIARKIDSGELAPDRPIPSENHLADEYGVARLTARRAAKELRKRGLIVTVRGKGSFVVAQLPNHTTGPEETTTAD